MAHKTIDDNYTYHKITVNGILMYYVIGGKGDTIVLLHV
jgi:hypothetical protein